MSAASRSATMRKALVCLLLALACSAHAETITGRVVGVADGDTITVLDSDKVQHKIRLAGIDAPEKKQAFGNRSKESLSDMVFDKTVNVETEKRERRCRWVVSLLLRPDEVSISVPPEPVEASATLRQAQGERFIHHWAGSIGHFASPITDNYRPWVQPIKR